MGDKRSSKGHKPTEEGENDPASQDAPWPEGIDLTEEQRDALFQWVLSNMDKAMAERQAAQQGETVPILGMMCYYRVAGGPAHGKARVAFITDVALDRDDPGVRHVYLHILVRSEDGFGVPIITGLAKHGYRPGEWFWHHEAREAMSTPAPPIEEEGRSDHPLPKDDA